MSVLAFIPARGGSRRIPGKNRKLLAGRPLIAWTLDAAIASGVFDEIIVSSDDEAVVEIARECGARVDIRPDALAADRVRFIEVLIEFLERPANENRFKSAVVLLPTCPFRTEDDLKSARQLHHDNPDHSILSMSEYEFPPDFACNFDEMSKDVTLRHPNVYAHSTQSQSVSRAFHPNGSIYWAAVGRIRQTRSYFDGPIKGLIIPPERAIDLDYPHQWPLAEIMAAQLFSL